jgi:hypothetical protein
VADEVAAELAARRDDHAVRRQLDQDGLLAMLMTLRDRFGENDEAMAQVFPNVRALRGLFDLLGVR